MLREKTQRRLCRVLFVIGCIVPTLLVGGWAFARFHPAYRMMLLGAISQRVGLEVTCDRIQTPRPGVFTATNVQVSDPLSGDLLGRCDRLTAQQRDGKWHTTLGEVEIERPDTFSRLSARQPIRAGLTATVKSLAITRNLTTLARWERLRLDVAPGALTLRSHSPDGQPDGELLLTRNDEGESSQLSIHLDTGTMDLPGSLLPFEGNFSKLAASAHFQGTCNVKQVGSISSGSAKGTLVLDSATPEETKDFAGWTSANISLHEVKWHGPIVSRLHADIDARDGTLARGLVWGLNDRLGCRDSEALRTLWKQGPEEGIPFDQLACEIEFDAGGLILVGGCANLTEDRQSGAIAHALMTRGGIPLLFQPRERPLPLFTVLQALWPSSPARLPATAEAQSLARYLPFPSTK